jgi:hypothetical protein
MTTPLAGAVAYGLLIFASTALLGFVVLPLLAISSGLFPIEAEARAFFSLLTLKGAPYLAALSVLGGALYPALSRRRLRLRLGLYVANALLAWLAGASIALAILR